MATTRAPIKTKITDQFTITGENGEVFQVEQHTRVEVKKIDGVKTEVLGSAYLLTSDGRGVLTSQTINSYSIPSLGVKATRQAS